MSKEKKYNAEEIASKLEAKAKQIRESGLTQNDLGMAAGGAGICPCSGSNCSDHTRLCSNNDENLPVDQAESCRYACIVSSPD